MSNSSSSLPSSSSSPSSSYPSSSNSSSSSSSSSSSYSSSSNSSSFSNSSSSHPSTSSSPNSSFSDSYNSVSTISHPRIVIFNRRKEEFILDFFNLVLEWIIYSIVGFLLMLISILICGRIKTGLNRNRRLHWRQRIQIEFGWETSNERMERMINEETIK